MVLPFVLISIVQFTQFGRNRLRCRIASHLGRVASNGFDSRKESSAVFVVERRSGGDVLMRHLITHGEVADAVLWLRESGWRED